jgi:Xaa-Pro aminopeptidase
VHDPAQFSYGDRISRRRVHDRPGSVSARMLDVLPDTPKNRAFIAKVRPAVARYEGTGVRIEDDYLITDTGLERLSNAPREIAEIEALMKKRARPIVP